MDLITGVCAVLVPTYKIVICAGILRDVCPAASVFHDITYKVHYGNCARLALGMQTTQSKRPGILTIAKSRRLSCKPPREPTAALPRPSQSRAPEYANRARSIVWPCVAACGLSPHCAPTAAIPYRPHGGRSLVQLRWRGASGGVSTGLGAGLAVGAIWPACALASNRADSMAVENHSTGTRG